MKKVVILLAISTLSTSVLAAESSWLDSLKSFVGLSEEKKEQPTETVIAAKPMKIADAPSSNGLIDTLTNKLNINNEQASGGMGAIFSYVKKQISADKFSQLAASLPGVDNLVNQAPDVSAKSAEASKGIGGLLDKAAEYSDSVKSINDVKKQFDALGLKPEMIGDFISTAQTYLDTEQGQKAKKILSDGLGKLLN